MVFESLCDSPRNAKRRKLAGGHAGLISGRIKPGFVSCPRARISWMIVLVSIWVLIILLTGEDERADGRIWKASRGWRIIAVGSKVLFAIRRYQLNPSDICAILNFQKKITITLLPKIYLIYYIMNVKKKN